MKYRVTTDGKHFRVERKFLGLFWKVETELADTGLFDVVPVVRNSLDECNQWIAAHMKSKWTVV